MVLLRGLFGNLLEALVAELACPHVAAHNVLASSVLDTESSSGLDDANALLSDHFDQLGASLVRNARVAASLEAVLALLSGQRRIGHGRFFRCIAVRFAHFGE